jgi:hypothetical protein
MRSTGSIPGSTVGIFREGEDSRGDHDLGRLVDFRFKAPPGTTSSSITTYTSSGQRNCASRASQPQNSVIFLPCPGGRTTKSTKDMWWHWGGGELYKFFQTYGFHAELYSVLLSAAMKDVTNPNSNQPRSKSSVRRHGIVFEFQLPFWWAGTNYKMFCTSCLVTQSVIKIIGIKFCQNSLGSFYSSVDITCPEVTDTVRSCSRHDVVAARLISERPGSINFYFKQIYPLSL